jgi:hypothetical protein
MLYPFNLKRLFLGIPVAVLIGILVLGMAGPASADTDFHKGKFRVKLTCDSGVDSTKSKLKADILEFQIDPLPFPAFDLKVTLDGFPSSFTGSGVAVTKNHRVAEFHAQVTNLNNQQLFFRGKFIVDPNTDDPDVKKANGMVLGFDLGNDCIYVGKFKTKTDPNPIIP